MTAIIGAQASPVGPIQSFDGDGFLDVARGDYLIVKRRNGVELVQVVQPPRESRQQQKQTLAPVLRKATIWDFLERERLSALEEEALEYCRSLVRGDRRLDFKVVGCRYDLTGGYLTVSYSQSGRSRKRRSPRIRNFARQLAQELGVRIELQTTNQREAAKMLDGVGKCGRQLCCTTWLREFPDVKLRMAKNQQISLNPDEISGVCGRLLCCLSYEDEMYRTLTRSMPKVGARVLTPQGEGRVRFIYPLKKTMSVELEGNILADFSVDDLLPARKEASDCGPCGGCTHTRRAEAGRGDSGKQPQA